MLQNPTMTTLAMDPAGSLYGLLFTLNGLSVSDTHFFFEGPSLFSSLYCFLKLVDATSRKRYTRSSLVLGSTAN